MTAFARSSRAYEHQDSWHPSRQALERSLLASVLTLLALMLSTLVATSLTSYRPPPAAADPPALQVAKPPTPELPREWRWERDPVTFDHAYAPGATASGVGHMYRSRR